MSTLSLDQSGGDSRTGSPLGRRPTQVVSMICAASVRHFSPSTVCTHRARRGSRYLLHGAFRAFHVEDRPRGGRAADAPRAADQSQRLREAARHALDDSTKRRLATDALVLAQLAEAIERNGGIRRMRGCSPRSWARMRSERLTRGRRSVRTCTRRSGRGTPGRRS
jgi:hypothetical protein